MLSVIVICKNEADRIKVCLESIKWADEIIIADNGSSDNTLQIAKKYTDKVFVFEGDDFSALRNAAMEKVKSEWVFYLDADERIVEPLKKEIQELIRKTNNSAYAISRRNIIFGKEQKYKAFWPDWVIRLLKKSDFQEWTGRIHEYPKFRGELGYTKNSLLHLTHRNVDQVVQKSLDWSKIDAQLRFESGHPKMTSWRFLRILLFELFNQIVKRQGILGGTIGVMDSILQTFSLLITYIRLWEIQQSKSLSEKYDELDRKLIESDFK